MQYDYCECAMDATERHKSPIYVFIRCDVWWVGRPAGQLPADAGCPLWLPLRRVRWKAITLQALCASLGVILIYCCWIVEPTCSTHVQADDTADSHDRLPRATSAVRSGYVRLGVDLPGFVGFSSRSQALVLARSDPALSGQV